MQMDTDRQTYKQTHIQTDTSIKTSPGKSTVMGDYGKYLAAMRDEDGTPLYGIVAECAGQIVGVAVIRAEMVSCNLFYNLFYNLFNNLFYNLVYNLFYNLFYNMFYNLFYNLFY